MDARGDVLVYPTVSSSLVFIQAAGTINIDLYNAAGQRLQSKEVKGNDYLDIAALPAGVYLVKVRENNSVFRVIKQ